jgi:hypothetical protein
LVAAAFTAAGTGIANADSTRGDHSLLGGNQLRVPIFAPIASIFGNNVNVLSDFSRSARTAHAHLVYKDNDAQGASLAGGSSQAAPPMSASINVCGNALSTAHGIGTAACKGRANVADDNPAQAAPMAESAESEGPVGASASIGAPGTPAAPAVAPAANPSAAGKSGPANEQAQAPAANDQARGPAANDQAQAPAANDQTRVPAANNQAQAPVRPVNICGNAGALGGVATAACEGTASSGRMLGHRAGLLPAYSASLAG